MCVHVCLCVFMSVYVGMYISAFCVSVCPHVFLWTRHSPVGYSGLLDGQVSDVRSHQFVTQDNHAQLCTVAFYGLDIHWPTLAC